MSQRICIHEDCGKPVRARQWCVNHYKQMRLAGAFAPITLLERFERDLSQGPNGCWNWTGAMFSSGYGVKWDGKRRVPAHRWSYEYHVAPIPAGLVIDHLCSNRRCVNPWHLEPVTNQVNTQRGKAGAINGGRQRAKTHCQFGHPYSADNTYLSPRGDRQCRTCKRAKDKVAGALQMGNAPVPTW